MQSIENYITEADAFFLLGKYSTEEGFEHEKKVLQISLYLFDNLKLESCTKNQERNLLKYSALFHDLGYFIAKKNHHQHSSYIIQNERLLQSLPEELLLALALICENHRKIPLNNLDKLPKESEQTLINLISILRIADALSNPVISSIKLEAYTKVLSITFNINPTTAYLSKLMEKSTLFEASFDTSLNLIFPI